MTTRAKKRKQQGLEATVERALTVVVPWVRESLTKLRREYARRLKIRRAVRPGVDMPCETCAFRTTADFSDGDIGFLQTTMSLVHALDKGYPFFCHERERVDGEYVPRRNEELGCYQPCAGWVALMGYNILPEPANVRALLGDEIVDFMVAGHNVFNPEQREDRV